VRFVAHRPHLSLRDIVALGGEEGGSIQSAVSTASAMADVPSVPPMISR
jgi:hypothetical protein